MTPWAIADTGPLVAVLDRGERHHAWAVEQVRRLEAPLLVCEPVLTEAMYLLGRLPAGQDSLLGLLESGALRLAFPAGDHVPALRELCRTYRLRPHVLVPPLRLQERLGCDVDTIRERLAFAEVRTHGATEPALELDRRLLDQRPGRDDE